jgi:deoxyribodipyrimidine photo-lyase
MRSPTVATSVVVFTRDLRLHDNPALAAALASAESILPLFVLDETILADAAANRLGFLDESLRDLDRSLRDRGSRLVISRGNWIEQVMGVAHAVGAHRIDLADDVSAFAKDRTDRLRGAAQRAGVLVVTHPGVTVVAPGDLLPQGARQPAYQVFTPYHRAWSATTWRTLAPTPGRMAFPDSAELPGIEALDSLQYEGRSPNVIAGGESAARRHLDTFLRADLERYDECRDALAADATSRISAFLHFGCLSPLETATRLRELPAADGLLRQLCWRDFFHQVLAARPESAHRDHRLRIRNWNDDPQGFEAWRSGTTGFPLVDAGMRQLADEGFMHNRARMVVASFLTKDLFVDWRLGAAHFMAHLVDGDVANNQLNWQWVAGTGTDTNRHRVLNPVLQSRRFDPDGEYLRRYLPELAGVAAPEIHWPEPGTRGETGYPAAIVDHQQAIELYRARR